MNPTFDLLVALAGIAGIFVGFGALVALSDRDETKVAELHMVRNVVVIGLLTLIGALLPIAIGGFGVSERALWGWSGGIFLTLIWFGLLHPTNRPILLAVIRTDPKAALFFWLVLEPPIQIPLILCVFGIFPQHGAALYTVAVIVNLVECAQVLLQVVYARVKRKEPS